MKILKRTRPQDFPCIICAPKEKVRMTVSQMLKDNPELKEIIVQELNKLQ